MQEKHLYEYAVLRIMPRVEREEFLNVGIVLYCAGKKFLQAKYHIDMPKLAAFCGSCDIPETEEYLEAFVKICKGEGDAGPISKLPAAARFRWLTATRSTIVQTSKVHPGFCDDPQDMLDKLYESLVL